LAKPKKRLTIRKRVFHFTAYRRFAALNLLFPINMPFGHPLDAFVAAIDTVKIRMAGQGLGGFLFGWLVDKIAPIK
jgi:hypothetical protein